MTRLVRLASAFAVSAALMLALSGPGTRLGLWPWSGGLILFGLAGVLGVAAVIAAAIGRRFAVLALGAAVAAMPVYGLVQAFSAPRINDASSALVLAGSAETTFPKALAAAEAMRWEIVKSDPRDGRIEAVATTFWFGFKDDVVVRVRPDGSGSRVEARSKSRVGRGDMGTNARRIQAYFEHLK
jgi:uncharacterized protein DUF1499